MRILLYGINYSPELTGIGKYTGELATWLAQQGHLVKVITAPPYYPQWKVADGYRAWLYRRESDDGVSVVRAPLWVPQQPGGLKRILHLFSFALTSVPPMIAQLAWRPHLVWVVEPPLFVAPTALLVAKLSRATAWMHVQDFEVDAAFALDLLKGAQLRSAVLRYERWLLRKFDVVSSISDKMLAKLEQKGVLPAKRFFFPNWVDVSHINPHSTGGSYRSELNIPVSGVVALYSGNMGAKQGLEMLPAVASLLISYSNLYFVFCGEGSSRAALIEQSVNLPNVRFLPIQPFAKLGDLLCMADIHLLPQRADDADLVMPSKLTGMLASGRPVVATASVDSEVGKIASFAGIAVEPGQPDKMAAAIVQLCDQPALRQQKGAAGRQYVEATLSKDAVLKTFENRLRELVAAYPRTR